MKKNQPHLLLALATLPLLLAGLAGCSGSGAVTPLQPSNQTKADANSAPADSDVIYWTAFPVTFNLTDALNGVALIDKKLGWACGNNGTVLKWDGETWSRVETGYAKNENLLAVAFANENEGWFTGSHGIILHYNNGTWTQEDAQTQESLYSLAVTRAKTVWVVGSNATILTFNGVSWGKMTTSSEGTTQSPVTVADDLYGVNFSDQNNGWAVGNRGTILRYDGTKWAPYPGSPSTERLNSVSCISNVQAWIVGAFGTILSFNGTVWNKQGNAFSGVDLYDIFMKDESDGWVAGQDGTLLYYDGSRWISHQKPLAKPSMNSLAFYKDLGFAVGANGTILKFQPNGEMTKFSFLFKGDAPKKPTKANPYWSVTYTLLNQSPKTSPFLTYEVPIPKGMEPYQPKPTGTPQTGQTAPGGTGAPVAMGIPSPVASPTPASSTPSAARPLPAGTTTPGAAPGAPTSQAAKMAAPVSGNWKVKDNNIIWDIGTVAASEMKSITLQLQSKKGEKKEFPVVLKAVLRALDRDLAEAAPVTVMASEPPAEPVEPSTEPKKTGIKAPKAGNPAVAAPAAAAPAGKDPTPAQSGPATTPAASGGELSNEKPPANAKPVGTPGN